MTDQIISKRQPAHYFHAGTMIKNNIGATNYSNKRRHHCDSKRCNNHNIIMKSVKISCMIMALAMTKMIGSVDAFHSAALSNSPLKARVVRSSTTVTFSTAWNRKSVVAKSAGNTDHNISNNNNRIIAANNNNYYYGRISKSATALHLSNDNTNINNDDSSLQLIQQWLLLHLPSLSTEDLSLYSTQLLQDGFDTVQKLERVNDNKEKRPGSSSRLEDLYFMKKGHRRVLLQKIGKVREMKGNAKNRLRLFEEESGDDGGDVEKRLDLENSGDDDDQRKVVRSEGDKYKPTIGTTKQSSSLSSFDNNDDDDSLISLTAWENKQLEEFVYNEQERDAMDDKSRRRLKEIDDYLREQRRKNKGSGSVEGGGDEYDVTTFDTKELGEFVYNEQTRDAMDDKSNRRLKEIEAYLAGKSQRERGEEDVEELLGEFDTTTFEQKELEEFVYNEQTRDAMDDKSKRRLKEIEAYIVEQRRLQRERRGEEEELQVDSDNEEEDMEEEGEGASLSSPSHPSSWNFADLEDFMYNEQEREVMDDKGKRRLKEIEEYVRSERNRLRDDSNFYGEEEELLDDFAARYQGIVTARDEKKSAGTVVSSSVAKEERRLEEFREAWLARQRKGRNQLDEEELMDDFASRYQKLGTATADGVSGGSSEKSERRLKDLDAFLRARQSRQSKGMRGEQRDTPMDDFQARYQKIGSSAADAVADGRSDKSSRRLRALDAFLKSRQMRAAAAEEEEALRLELLQKPLKDLTATERKERIRVEEFQRRARDAKKKQGSRVAKNAGKSASAATAVRRKSNEERRLEEMGRWIAKQKESVEKRRITKMLEEYQRLKRAESKKLKKPVIKSEVKQDKPPPPPPLLTNEDVIIDDFFEKKRVHSMSTTLPPSNDARRLQQTSSSPKSDDEDCVGDECFDITRNSFAERDSKSLSTTLQPSNKNAKKDTYIPGTKDKVSDFLPPRSDSSNDKDVEDEESFDISRSSYSERESKSLSTTLPPSNKNAKQNSYVPGSESDDEDCVGDECVDITRSSFSEREVRSLSTTLPPSNENAKRNTYVPGSKSDEEECSGEDCVDITRSSFSERGVRSLSTTLPPSNENAKQNSYVPGSKGDDEECVGDECFDISRSSFPERESKSLSTTLPPSNKNAKRNSYVPGSKSDEEECEGDDCVDITRSSFSEREVRSLSTTLPPSNENAKPNTYVSESKKKESDGGVEPDEYFDITTRLFQERGQSLSSGYQSVFREEERSEMNSRASSLYAKFQSTKASPSSSSAPSTRQITRTPNAREQNDMEDAYMDITQRLWDERQAPSLSSPPASSFKEEEKSEMNDRPRPTETTPRGDSAASGSYSSLSQFVNTGPKRRSDDSGGYVDASERFSDRSSFVQSVNSGTAKRGTTSGSFKDSSRSVSAPVSDHVDESERFSDRSSFVQSVNSGTNRKGMTSGSYKDRGATTAPASDESGDYVDESERFSERSSFVQSVNTGTAKRGTTSGSFAESKGDIVRPGSSSSDIDDGYEDITQNPFSRDRSSFVLRVNSGTSKAGTTTGSFRESKGKSEPEERKYFSSDRSTLMGARTWRNEDVVANNEHEKYLSSDRSSIVGAPYLRDAGKSSDEHKKYMSSDGSSIVGAPSIRNAVSSEAHRKNLSSNRSSLSGAPSIRRREVTNEYLDTNQFSSNLSPSSPVKASATNKVWRTTSEKGVEEASIDTPPAFMKNLDMLAGGRKIKMRSAPDEYLNKNSFTQKLSPSTMTQAATVASRNNNPYLNKYGFNDIDSMRTSNASGVQFKRSHDVSPEEKKHLDNLDTKWAKLPDFDEMAGQSAAGVNAAGSRSPKRQEDEEYTMVGDFSRLERATSFVRDSNTAAKSDLRSLSEMQSSDQPGVETSSVTEEEDIDSEFEVMNWLLKHLPQLDEEDAVNYFVSLLEDGFDSTDMLDEVLEEDLYFMKEEHQILLMENLAIEEQKTEEKHKTEEELTSETTTTAFSESVKSMKTELDEASSWLAEKAEEVQERDIAKNLAEQEMVDAKEKEPTNDGGDDEYTDITRADFGDRVSLSSAAPPLFEKEHPSEDEKEPFSWQLDVRKELTKGDEEDDESLDDISLDSFSYQSTESNQLFQATPPVAVDLEEGSTVQESASKMKERRPVVETRNIDSGSRPLFQATPPLMVELKEGMTAEEAALAREERLSGESHGIDTDTAPLPSQITEGMTAEEAEAARSTRLNASGESAHESDDEPSPVEEPKEMQKSENILPPRDALYQEYLARGFTTEQAQKLKDYYTTWTMGPSHEMKFTSVFTCPISGEHFASGIMDNGEVWGGQVWYRNKKQAMNAAAAKAMDCFAYRENSSGETLSRCEDDPYFEDEVPTLSPPPNVMLPTELIQPDNT